VKSEELLYQELCGTFRQEASEMVERLGGLLVQVETVSDAAEAERLLQAAFREAHNLKGTASSLRFTLTARLAHSLEFALGRLRDPLLRRSAGAYDPIHRALEAVASAITADPDAFSDPLVDAAVAALGAPAPPVRATEPPSVMIATPTPTAREPRTQAGSAPRTGTPTPTPSPTPSAIRSSTRAGVKVDETLRVATRKLGALMSQVGELLAARLRTDQRLSELKQILAGEEARLRDLRTARDLSRDGGGDLEHRLRRLTQALGDGLQRQGDMVRRLRNLVRAFESDTLRSTILSGGLQDDIRRVRMFPLQSVFDPLPRVIRQLARELGKRVRFETEGGDLELDKKVLDELRDPLNHIVRNSCDHGVELPEARMKAGKPPEAVLKIRAELRGETIAIQIVDDGPGIDLEAVRRTAIERGVLSAEEARVLRDRDLYEILFAPGFSTRGDADELSGRGVGLDVVRRTIERMHGSVHLDSVQGVGTTITIVLPLAIYIIRALVVRVARSDFVLPVSSVQRILRVSAADVVEIEGQSAVLVEGQPIALLGLAPLVGLETTPRAEGERFPVVIVGTREAPCGLAVDDIVGDQEIVAKNLEPPLVRVRHIAGATVLADGRVVLILNPLDILRSATARSERRRVLGTPAPGPARSRPRVLLVEDSLTSRTLEKNVLEVAGFFVRAVPDGSDALAALESETFDIVVSDVMMPTVGGLELTRRIRAEPRWRTLPVLLVTSLGGAEDRVAGLQAGADGYIVKSEFDHEQLVAKVNELLGRA
jgi:two-component system, chemotaxis family, sensor kinase CheA